MKFDESEHPRDSDGKFTDGTGRSGEEKLEEAKRIYDTEEISPSELSESRKPQLSRQEWAMFYERIGKIKAEGHSVTKTSNGDMLIPIETKDSNVLVIANGTYKKPNVKFAVRFENNRDMYDTIERLENYE